MRYFFDTEFIEDGKTIDLISIGIVSEDGFSFYAEIDECDLSKANPWVRENVIPNLIGDRHPRQVVRKNVKNFVDAIQREAGSPPEFWGYYADYDWVALCQLFGTMTDLPKGWPMYCRDFKQWLDDNGNPELPKHLGVEHNALDDAMWLRRVFNELRPDLG